MKNGTNLQDCLMNKNWKGSLNTIKRLGLISMLIVLAVAGLLVVTSCTSPHKAGDAVYDEVAPRALANRSGRRSPS